MLDIDVSELSHVRRAIRIAAGVPGSRPGPAQALTPARASRIQLGPEAAFREMSGSSSSRNLMVAQQIEEQKSSYLHATMHRPPTNLPASQAAAQDQHKHRHLHALRAVSSAQKQQFGK